MNRWPLRVLALLAVSGVAAVRAQAADDSACPTIADPAARLACYDAVKPPRPAHATTSATTRAPSGTSAGSAATAPASAPAPVIRPGVAVTPPVPVAPPPAAAPTDATAAQPSRLALMFRPKHRSDANAAGPERIRATVTQVQMRPVGQVITLDNGQVWQITEYRRDPFVQAHDAVDVSPASLGSFIMANATGGAGVYVKRLH